MHNTYLCVFLNYWASQECILYFNITIIILCGTNEKCIGMLFSCIVCTKIY